MTSTVLPVVNVSDLPSPYDEPVCAVGTVTAAEVAPSQSGEYQRVHLVAKYPAPNGSERTAHIRFNLKLEWLTPAFAAKVRAGAVDNNTAIQYRINVAGLWRSLFRSADLTQTDLSALVGRQVGFLVDYQYDKKTGLPAIDKDTSAPRPPEIRRFFPPTDYERTLASYEAAAAKRRATVAGGPEVASVI